MKIASAYMHLPVRTEITPTGTAAELVSQELFIVSRDLKGRLLGELLKQYSGSVLLFIRTKIGARKVARILKTMGHSASEIHADRTLAQRKEALSGFKSGKYRILVATDIAARGIDVKGIELVINYDLPDDPENYVHRIGRTGRAGLKGRSISLATPDQEMMCAILKRLSGRLFLYPGILVFPRKVFLPRVRHRPGHIILIAPKGRISAAITEGKPR